MTENIELALQLMIVGMLSVFFILGIVTGLARLLIILVNKFAPETIGSDSTDNKSIDQKNVAIIAAVVDVLTQGKAVVHSIKKVK